ncbi:MAG: hypothetical protein AAGB31_12025 [Bdellovibrio sp.]
MKNIASFLLIFLVLLSSKSVLAQSTSLSKVQLLERFLVGRSAQASSLTQQDYQGALRMIHVYKIKLAELFELKFQIDKFYQSKNLSIQQVESISRFLNDVLVTQKELSRLQMTEKLHCRFALTDSPWTEVRSEKSAQTAIYAGCWASQAEDPLVKKGYDLQTLEKISK